MLNRNPHQQEPLDAIVIGAGPSGLSAGYQLKKSNLSYVIVEASNGVLSSYRYLWENFKIAQPIKEIKIEGLEFPKKFSSDHQLKRDELIGIYNEFVTQHQLHIKFSTKVTSINKTMDTIFEVHTNTGFYTAKNVIMALSMNAKFRFPDFISTPLLTQYKHIMMHSAWYQGIDALKLPKNASVLVVGSGLYALTVAKELKDHQYKISLACGYDDKQIAENNKHLDSIPIKLDELKQTGIPNFGKLTNIQNDQLSFESKHTAKITEYSKIIFATGYSYSPDLIGQLLDGCIKDAKEKVVNHVEGAITDAPGVYLVGIPPKGRNTTTFTESDKCAANIIKTIVKKNLEIKSESLNTKIISGSGKYTTLFSNTKITNLIQEYSQAPANNC